MMQMLGLPNVRWFNQTDYSMIAVSVIEAANALAAGACDYALVYRALHHPAGVRYHDNPATTAGGQSQFTTPYGHGGGGPRQALHFQRYIEKYGRAPRGARERRAQRPQERPAQRERRLVRARDLTRRLPQRPRHLLADERSSTTTCPSTAAGAVIMTTEDRARKARPTQAATSPATRMTPHNLERGGLVESLEDLYAMDGLHAENLYRSAGLGPDDVDVLHLYDGFSPMMWTRMETFQLLR